VLKEGEDVLPESRYPVTVGRALEDKAKEEIYGIYVWNAITSQDAVSQEQWQRAKPHVGGILGLNEAVQKKVLVRMVSRWCDMFIKQKMQESGSLGEDDIFTLKTWAPTFFGIDEEVTQDLLRNANKAMLQAQALKLLSKPDVSPSDVQQLRDDVEKWDLLLQKDLELTRPQLRSLFQVEVVSVLVDESLSLEQKQEAVAASRVSFGLREAEAAEEMQALLNQRCKGFLVNAVGSLMQGKDWQAVLEIKKLEQFVSFAATEGLELRGDWEVAPAMRQRLLRAYSGTALGDVATMVLLQQVLGVAATT